METIIRYTGTPPRTPNLVVDWAGGATQEQYRLWHIKSFCDAAETGIEICFPFADCEIEPVVAPFVDLSDKFYMLELDAIIDTPTRHNLFIIPHYRFYSSDWNAPLPVACSLELDWFPNLVVLFRKPPPGYKTIFRKDEPFAQAIVVPRSNDYKIVEMSKYDTKQKMVAKKFISENGDRYVTRKWTTAYGSVQDNLYEVLSSLEKLPSEIKGKRRFKLI